MSSHGVYAGATLAAAVAFVALAAYHLLSRRSTVDPDRVHDVAVSSLSAPVVAVDGDGDIAHHNPAAEALFGGEPPHEGEPLADHLPELADQLAAAGGELSVELTAQVDGRRRFLTATATPLDPGWVVTLLDVTDRELREQRMDVLNRLLRHNVRTETSIILGHGQRVADGAADDDLAAAGEAIVAAAESLATVSDEATRMNRLLDVEVDQEPVDAAAAVRELVADCREDHPEATIETALADRAMTRCHVSVRDAVVELVQNAVVHSDRDRPSVTVTVEDGDDWVTVSVADDGPGIPEDELAAIREGGESQLVHASGLGLWLVSWTTTASGGRVNFEDDEPRGSVVRLELPAA